MSTNMKRGSDADAGSSSSRGSQRSSRSSRKSRNKDNNSARRNPQRQNESEMGPQRSSIPSSSSSHASSNRSQQRRRTHEPDNVPSVSAPRSESPRLGVAEHDFTFESEKPPQIDQENSLGQVTPASVNQEIPDATSSSDTLYLRHVAEDKPTAPAESSRHSIAKSALSQNSSSSESSHRVLGSRMPKLRQRQKKLLNIMKALQEGYLPSNEQILDCLNNISDARILNQTPRRLGKPGRRLISEIKDFLQALTDVLEAKNENDEIQHLIFSTFQSKLFKADIENSNDIGDGFHSASEDMSAQFYEDLRDPRPEWKQFRENIEKAMSFGPRFNESGQISDEEPSETLYMSELIVKKFMLQPKKVRAFLLTLTLTIAFNARFYDIVSDVLEVLHMLFKFSQGGNNSTDELDDWTDSPIVGILQHLLTKFNFEMDSFEAKVLQSRAQNLINKLKDNNTLRLLSTFFCELFSYENEEPDDRINIAEKSKELKEIVISYMEVLAKWSSIQAVERLISSCQELISIVSSDETLSILSYQTSKVICAYSRMEDYMESNQLEDDLKSMHDLIGQIEDTSPLASVISIMIVTMRDIFKKMASSSEIITLKKASVRLKTEFDSLFGKPITESQKLQKWMLRKDLLQIILPELISQVKDVLMPEINLTDGIYNLCVRQYVLEPYPSDSFLPYRFQLESRNIVGIRNLTAVQYYIGSNKTLKIYNLGLFVRDAAYYFSRRGWISIEDRGLIDLMLDVSIQIDFADATTRKTKPNQNSEKDQGPSKFIDKVSVEFNDMDFNIHDNRHSWLVKLLKPMMRSVIQSSARKLIIEYVNSLVPLIAGLLSIIVSFAQGDNLLTTETEYYVFSAAWDQFLQKIDSLDGTGYFKESLRKHLFDEEAQFYVREDMPAPAFTWRNRVFE